ncbi:MAG: hypothetical protein WCL10_19405 [Novosphingobium sp.]|uniref:hypothetical protein n=1 Tax=Novosphingobium sp. TaxID=1874826 RepID=UPI00301AD186
MTEEFTEIDFWLATVLENMSRDELKALVTQAFKRTDHDTLDAQSLRRLVAHEFSTAASRSLPWARPIPYSEIVRMVAKRLKLPAPADSAVSEIERPILFKVLEKSIEKMSREQKEGLASRIESQLRERGIDKKVAFDEVFDFVKFAAMDVGGTVGGLVLAGPGIAGVIGLNFLQWIILEAVILTSGHLAAAGAVFGFGTAGALMAAAGWAGPVGAALALLYTGYVLTGPAFRKLIPAVCVIAAKRLEQAALSSPVNQ